MDNRDAIRGFQKGKIETGKCPETHYNLRATEQWDLSRDPRRLESGIFSPASANKVQSWRLNKYACAALGLSFCAIHELSRLASNVKQTENEEEGKQQKRGGVR